MSTTFNHAHAVSSIVVSPYETAVFPAALPKPRTRFVRFEVPVELADALERRCRRLDVSPSRLIATLILYQVSKADDAKFGTSMLSTLESWESGKRKVPGHVDRPPDVKAAEGEA